MHDCTRGQSDRMKAAEPDSAWQWAPRPLLVYEHVKLREVNKNSVLAHCRCQNRMHRLSNSWFILLHISNCTRSVWQLGYGLDDRRIRVRFPAESRDLLFSTTSTLSLGPIQPPWAVFLSVRRSWHEAEDSSPSSAEVWKGGNTPPFPHTCSRLVA